jgi:hypothetical protein
LICTLHFDFFNPNLVPKKPLGIVPDFLNENLVSQNVILGLPEIHLPNGTSDGIMSRYVTMVELD